MTVRTLAIVSGAFAIAALASVVGDMLAHATPIWAFFAILAVGIFDMLLLAGYSV